MELRFTLRPFDERREARECKKLIKKNNRIKTVEDMLCVRKARKKALEEEKIYKQQNTTDLPSKHSRLWRAYQKSKLKKSLKQMQTQLSTILLSIESFYYYMRNILVEATDYVSLHRKQFVAMAAVLLLLFGGLGTYNYFTGFEVIANGENIGIITSRNEFKDTLDEIKGTLQDLYDKDSVILESNITLKKIFISDRSALLSHEEFKDRLLYSGLGIYYEGGVITIDGVETLRLASVEEAQEAIDTFMHDVLYTADEGEFVDLISSEIKEDVQVEQKIIAVGSEYTVEEAVAYLKNIMKNGSAVAVSSSEENALSASLFSADLRGLVSPLAFRGSDYSISMLSDDVALNITVTKEIIYTVDIPYTSTEVHDPNAYIGTREVQSDGVPGVLSVDAIITYVNGEAVSETIQGETVTVEPVAEVIAIGTKALPPVRSTGVFQIPVNGRVSRIDGDGNSHSNGRAVDIAAPTGTVVHASDAGVVARAGWGGDYGNLIIIIHSGGYSTYYAHLSAIDVIIGQQVSQGDPIGKVGSTGYSTGPHLHFEIRYNGVRTQLQNYFSFLAKGVVVTWGMKQDTAFEILFDANEGSGSMAKISVAYNKSYTVPECTFTPPDGKEFDRWDLDGTALYPGDKITITKEITLKAIWKTAETSGGDGGTGGDEDPGTTEEP